MKILNYRRAALEMLMAKKGYKTMKEFAEKTGLKENVVYAFCIGKYTTLQTALTVAKALDMSDRQFNTIILNSQLRAGK